MFSGDSGGSAINKLFSIISSDVMQPPLTGYTRLGMIIEYRIGISENYSHKTLTEQSLPGRSSLGILIN